MDFRHNLVERSSLVGYASLLNPEPWVVEKSLAKKVRIIDGLSGVRIWCRE